MTQRKTEFKPGVPVQHVQFPGRDSSAAAGPLSALQRRADESAVAQRLRDVQSLADRSAIQRAAEAVEVEEEEPVQGKLLQAAGLEEEEPLQGKLLQPAAMDEEEPLQAKAENASGLPGRLKAGIEALSGVSTDGVRVHPNSAAPAGVNAHAYAQGTDIHLAPGQERHLPHEAWHVVQQRRAGCSRRSRRTASRSTTIARWRRKPTSWGRRRSRQGRPKTRAPLPLRNALSASGSR